VKVLIDTHVFLWALSCPERLTPERRHTIASRTNQVFLSSMSIAELMLKHASGKIDVDFDPLAMAEQTGIQIIDFTGADAMMLGRLPLHHRDPFDRMIISQALANGLPIMSDDPQFLKYDCEII